MAKISAATIDKLIILGFTAIDVLGKLSKGEEITDEDLKLETLEDTVARVRADLGMTEV